MADDEEPAHKKRKVEIATTRNVTLLYRERQEHVPLSDLYGATLVKITVWNAENDPDGVKKRTFTVPRGLLCARSAYFKKLFTGSGFREAAQGHVELPDVSAGTFKVFVGWLYTQTIYYDPDQKTAAGVGLEGGTTSVAENPSPHSNIEESGNLDPVSWNDMDLYRLYVFADKYDTRSLRMTVLDIIQLKILQAKPREYLLPNTLHVVWVVSNLPPSSPLRRCLVDAWATWLSNWSTREEYEKEFAKLPQDFLADCFAAVKTFAMASSCPRCKRGGKKQATCTGRGHNERDQHFLDKDPCSYHEHGDDDVEKAACQKRWQALSGQVRQNSWLAAKHQQ